MAKTRFLVRALRFRRGCFVASFSPILFFLGCFCEGEWVERGYFEFASALGAAEQFSGDGVVGYGYGCSAYGTFGFHGIHVAR